MVYVGMRSAAASSRTNIEDVVFVHALLLTLRSTLLEAHNLGVSHVLSNFWQRAWTYHLTTWYLLSNFICSTNIVSSTKLDNCRCTCDDVRVEMISCLFSVRTDS
jgi:hypothetical protein